MECTSFGMKRLKSTFQKAEKIIFLSWVLLTYSTLLFICLLFFPHSASIGLIVSQNLSYEVSLSLVSLVRIDSEHINECV